MSGPFSKPPAWRHRQGQHRRVRSLEQRAAGTDAEVARLRRDVDACMNLMRMMRAPVDGQVPDELTSALARGQREVRLSVAGEELMAGLDSGQPADVIDILRAVRRCAADGTEVAS